MTADSDSLQGSLFEEVIEAVTEQKTAAKQPECIEHELTDNQLTEDAKNRPRTRDSSEKQIQNTHSDPKSIDGKESEEDLPPWSHHSLIDIKQLTPALRHYVELKTKNRERVLLYRLGDFFECFFEDAILLSRLLELTLTSKEGGKAIGRVPMAGIPHHAVERYCSELIKRGFSVALCDQLETTASKGNLLKRDITRVLTPGTVIEAGMLQSNKNNWLAAVVVEPAESAKSLQWGLACADISTGEFLLYQREDSDLLLQELTKLEAAEIIWGEYENTFKNLWCPDHLNLTVISKTNFNQLEAESALKNHYKLTTLNGLGLNETPLALKAAGGLVGYLNETQPATLSNSINSDLNVNPNKTSLTLDLPRIKYVGDHLILDAQTRRNLELTSTQRDGQFQGSLLWAVDRTLTAMGARCLRRWIEEPLIDATAIRARQSVVSKLVTDRSLRKNLRKTLRAMGDLERLAGRAGAGQSGARDLVAIADGLERLPSLAEQLQALTDKVPNWFLNLRKIDQNLIELASTIRHQLINNPPLSLSEGGLINDQVDPILDGLRNQLDDQNEWLRSQEMQERKLSNNQNLRIQYHRTFGYFLAVSKAKAITVPEHWIRRQTLANEERFITPDLKEREGRIFNTKARSAQREYEIFCNLRELVGKQANSIRVVARSVAGLDALTGLAEAATANSYCPPKILENKDSHIHKSRIIEIEACRHPVVEQILVEESFQPNDIKLGEGKDLMILTGPNASGKSCYLRQIGLVQLLAQIGSWVPAKQAKLSIADRIFTRVGAVDDLATGQSTFMVEMAETAIILNHATTHSLVLLDEIGRGTSTFDGLSIAWAVSEYLSKQIKSRTVFATHYHELNCLSKNIDNIANYQVLVEETGDDLIFLHRVVEGGASRSYGIEAARLAGVPKKVLQRANQVLNSLEDNQLPSVEVNNLPGLIKKSINSAT